MESRVQGLWVCSSFTKKEPWSYWHKGYFISGEQELKHSESTNLFTAAPTVDDMLFILWFLSQESISPLEAEHISHKPYAFSILGVRFATVRAGVSAVRSRNLLCSFRSWTRIANSEFSCKGKKKISNASHSNKTETEAQDSTLYSSCFHRNTCVPAAVIYFGNI